MAPFLVFSFVQVLIAVCLALHYIHAVKKIVHRDLTPANIVLGQVRAHVHMACLHDAISC
jgi:serine/threonine protein kinase